jgi:hypothetical protein
MHAYPFPWRILFPLVYAVLAGKRRSFRQDAGRAIGRLRAAPLVAGAERVKPPCLILVNHYTRPGLPAWWLALAVSAALPFNLHWVVTAAWRKPGLVSRVLTEPLSRRVLQGVERVYGFTTMPPMPPVPEDTAARAAAVRRVLQVARETDSPAIGLAPEGGDFAPPGRVAELWPGVGRFILHLTGLGLQIYPAALDEVDSRLRLRFGAACELIAPPDLSADERDAWARCEIRDRMQANLES